MLEYGRPDAIVERSILPIPERIFHFAAAVILPIPCFVISHNGYPGQTEYQRGSWYDYLSLVPGGKIGWSFYPLLLFSMYAAARTIFRPHKAINLSHIRLGLFAGVILAYQYAFIQVASLSDIKDPAVGIVVSLALPAIFVGGAMFVQWALKAMIWNRPWYNRGRGRLFFWLAVGGLTLAAVAITARGRMEYLYVVLFAPLFIAPALTLTTFVALSYLVIRHGDTSDRRWVPIPGAIGWVVLFIAAWVESYRNAAAAYARLPTSQPGCYVATAAAQGHRRVVGSLQLGGKRFNSQLAMLKAGEHALAARRPRVHRAFRMIYDRIGPRLAMRMGHPLVADLAYLTLKPMEWLTAAALALTALRPRADRSNL